MARRTFDVVDIIEILVHWQAGRNNSEIAQSAWAWTVRRCGSTPRRRRLPGWRRPGRR